MVIKDSVILQTLQQNRNAGGDLLFKRYYKPLVLFADSMISDRGYAEDLVQEVFYHFMKGQVYRTLPPEALSTYLFHAVKNTCLKKLSRKKRMVSELDMLRYDAIEEECHTIDPELIFSIHQEIEALPEKTRLIVKAILLKGKKYKEVAEEYQISLNTVKTLLSAGLKRLRQSFSHTMLLLILIKHILNTKK